MRRAMSAIIAAVAFVLGLSMALPYCAESTEQDVAPKLENLDQLLNETFVAGQGLGTLRIGEPALPLWMSCREEHRRDFNEVSGVRCDVSAVLGIWQSVRSRCHGGANSGSDRDRTEAVGVLSSAKLSEGS